MGQLRGGEKGLVVGNYCHDVIIRDGAIVGESLGGATSFIANVLDLLDIPCTYVSKVGPDFAYSVAHRPSVVPHSRTTLFHAHFYSSPTTPLAQDGDAPPNDHHSHSDRILRRLRACDPIYPSDLPVLSATPLNFEFEFGMVVGVAGEITPEILEHVLRLCRVVFVDVQALIRTFDPDDGTVRMVRLRDTCFVHFLPRIGFLKASSEEAEYIDVQEARNFCCIIVTEGRNGCRVYWKDGEVRLPSFPAVQVDPTGAGDSFLGGFAASFVLGLPVQEAALLGNFFGSLTVEQIGVPKLDPLKLQVLGDRFIRVKTMVNPLRSVTCSVCSQQVKDEVSQRVPPSLHGVSDGMMTPDLHSSAKHEDLKAALARIAKTLHTQI